MGTKLSVDVLSEKEIEDIAYETFFLLQNDWKRVNIDRYDDNYLADLSKKYLIDKLEGDVWVKDNITHFIFLDTRYDSSHWIEIRFFTREEAFFFEISKKEELNKLV